MSEEEIKLLNEMKDNCIKQANYVDARAMEKYNLLRKIEEGIQEKQDLIKYLEYELIKCHSELTENGLSMNTSCDDKLWEKSNIYQEILDKVKGEM